MGGENFLRLAVAVIGLFVMISLFGEIAAVASAEADRVVALAMGYR